MPNLGVAIVRQYERGVVFRLGRLRGVRKPGIRFMIPLADRMWKVTLRTVTMPIPSQQVITRDKRLHRRRTGTAAPAVAAPMGTDGGRGPGSDWPIPQDETLTDPLKGQVWT